MAESIKTSRQRKAADTRSDPSNSGWEKPYPEFQLSYHPASGRLYKKILGKRHYFGYAIAWEKARDKYLRERDDLFVGRTPRAASNEAGMSVALLCDHFLNAKRRLLESGEIGDRTFAEYHASCERIVKGLGASTPVSTVTPDDLGRFRASLARTRSAVTLNNEIQRCRSVFKFGVDEGLIQPVRMGQSFNKASKKVIRIAKATAGPKMYESSEIRLILDALDGMPVTIPGETEPVTIPKNATLRAMVLLGLNAAYGSNDLALLPMFWSSPRMVGAELALCGLGELGW